MAHRADVLIVTATKVESRAVLAAFESATGQKAQAISIADRVYRDLGTLNHSRVFLALSEMGSGGLGASQQTVHKAIECLRPSAVIMVGICFGINEKKQALGDILVARQLMLYDLQRVGGNQLVARGDRPHAATRLLNHLQSADLDWIGAPVCFGLVLTGEKLVDDIDYRDALQRLETEALGGEMEGGGLYVACQDAKVDWVLIKAICDWADGNKAQDKIERQQLAAENAALFVVHALLHTVLQHPRAAEEKPEIPGPAAPIPPRAAALPDQRPTRSSLRRLLAQVLRTTEDLDAFCVDSFPAVAYRFSSGMTRTAREDLLLLIIDTDKILASLRDCDPAAVARYESLLTYE